MGGLAGVLFLSAYILMIGMTVSAFRAMVMFLFRIGADLSGRHYDSPTALAAAAVTVCMWRPLSLYDSGFWLSFGALIAIIFILPIFKNLPAQSLWASVSVNLFLLPILMYSFYSTTQKDCFSCMFPKQTDHRPYKPRCHQYRQQRNYNQIQENSINRNFIKRIHQNRES